MTQEDILISLCNDVIDVFHKNKQGDIKKQIRRHKIRIKSIRTVCPKDITWSLLARWKGIVYVKTGTVNYGYPERNINFRSYK